MKRVLLAAVAIVGLVVGASISAGTAHAASIPFGLQQFATGLSSPVDIRNTGVTGDTRLFVVEKGGTIKILSNTGAVTGTFLDISSKIQNSGEGGLLGLAFDPNYSSNGYFYVFYTITGTTNDRVARFTRSTADTADATSEKIMLDISHPGYTNHHGGGLQFGPDGHLYISTGDGGGAGDPNNNAQDKLSPLGKILRIDNSTNPAVPYTVPGDNPYVGDGSYLPEIAYLGLRNPWRISFDRGNGSIYIADVGQGSREEVNVKTTGTLGDNFGWRCYEGTIAYNTAGCAAQNTYTGPVNEYDHGQGCSITGGYVYRGTRYPSLTGAYVFSDYCSGRFWSLVQDGITSVWTREQQLKQGSSYVTFGEDKSGELYVATLSGTINRIVSGGGAEGDPVHRFWSPRFANAHFFTTGSTERDNLMNNNDNYASGGNWVYEGIGYSAHTTDCTNRVPVYRFYSSRFNTHFFTASNEERQNLAFDQNWIQEGVAMCASHPTQEANSKPLYRFWSPNFKKHFFTTSEAEKTQLDQSDPNWDLEGTAYYVF